jgi:hypothetical protein
VDDRVRTGDLGDGDAALSRTELHPPAGGRDGDRRALSFTPAIWSRVRPATLRASDWSRTSCLPFTRRTLSQMSYRGTAAGQGFEPRLTGSGPAVLPVRRSGTGARAPPGTRTLIAELRVQCITINACGARSPTGESNPASQLGGLAHHHNACEARRLPQVPNLPLPGFSGTLIRLS